MKNLISNGIHNHLECLGYDITVKEVEDVDHLSCIHEIRSNLLVRIQNGFVMIMSPYKTSVTQISMDLLKLMDEINAKTLVSKWYLLPHTKGETVDVHVEAYMYGYNKQTFGRILERMEYDVNTYLSKINALQKK